jgi:hypothetical protein
LAGPLPASNPLFLKVLANILSNAIACRKQSVNPNFAQTIGNVRPSTEKRCSATDIAALITGSAPVFRPLIFFDCFSILQRAKRRAMRW